MVMMKNKEILIIYVNTRKYECENKIVVGNAFTCNSIVEIKKENDDFEQICREI